jgi:hypothetical protein
VSGEGRSRALPEAGPTMLPLILVFASLLPDLRAALPLRTYYFRDFSLTYLPLRTFFAREISEGRWPFWNRYLQEGCPFLPTFYPLEMIHALWSGPAAVSWLLTLHLPLAALACFALARQLGCSRWGAFASGSIYALGGFCLSCLNLHWFLQAMALAPALVLALRRASIRGGRAIPVAGLVLAVSISTLAIEFVAQAAILGVALGVAAAPRRSALVRLAVVGALGAGVAALPIALTLGIVAETLRGAGLPPEVMLQNSLHPVLLLQTIVPDLAGSIAEPLRVWWGGRLYTGGSPYFLSLYVGPVALALAVSGWRGFSFAGRWVLVVAAVLGSVYALGSYGGLAPLLHPLLRWFRFPVKAWLTPHLCLALWAGAGIDRLRSGAAWTLLAAGSMITAVLGAGVALTGAFWRVPLAAWLDLSPRAAALMEETLRREGSLALAASLGVAALAFAARAGRINPFRGMQLLLVLLVADLWRGAVGVNPQTSVDFFDAAPGLTRLIGDLDGGRVFSFGVNRSPAVHALLEQHEPGVDREGFLLARRVLDPFTNLIDAVEVAEGSDRLSFVPRPPAIQPGEYAPDAIGDILPRLRAAAVVRVISLDPLEDPGLRPRGEVAAGPAGMWIHVYDVLNPWPRAYVACRPRLAEGRTAAALAVLQADFDPRRDVVFEKLAGGGCEAGTLRERLVFGSTETYDVESVGPGYLVMRDNFSPSWTATLDERTAPVLRANGRHRAVALPGGRHVVRLRYQPPGLASGALATGLGLALLILLWARPTVVDGLGSAA